jgi:hypothetical protein
VIEEELYSRLREVICEELGVRPEEVVPGAYLVDGLRADWPAGLLRNSAA